MKRKCLVLLAILLCLSMMACGVKEDGSKKYKDMLKDVSVGDVIEFGTYEQDNITGNGKEPIRWIVLEQKGDSYFILTEQVLDVYPYHSNEDAVTWEDCNLRVWLNSVFFESAFNNDEMAMIAETMVYTESVHQKYYNSFSSQYVYTVEPLNACTTKDKLYILSRDEVEEYFRTDEAAIAKPSYYARLAPSVGIGITDPFEWATRTPGVTTGSQRYVDDEGSTEVGGASNLLCLGVRPCMWLSGN